MTSLADIRLAAQERADRVNGPMPVAEWDRLVNASAAGLYRQLGATYEDYNVQTFTFVLAGGTGGNILQVGPGSTVPAFDKLRYLSRQVTAGGGPNAPTWVPVLRADSPIDFDCLSAPILTPYYGTLAQIVKYWLYGPTLEVRPAASAQGTYMLYFVPSYQKLVNDTDTIDGTWMATNGIDEYIVLDVAAKALIKEESLDTAQILMADRERIKAEILSQFAVRDDNMPARIQDVKSMRRNGFGGDGWRGGW